MSATSFLRHRRAVAAKIVAEAVTKSPKRMASLFEEFSLTPGDMGSLAKNNDVLLMADRIAEIRLDEPELDTLEELNTLTAGERASVHSPDVRDDQVQDKLQQPCQETVDVGNMHDGPEAAEALANVGSRVLDLPAVDGDFVKGAAVEAAMIGDKLARGTGGRAGDPPPPPVDLSTDEGVEAAIKAGKKLLAEQAREMPEAAPSLDPAKSEITAEDEQKPTDPEGTQEGVASTPVDTLAAAEAVQELRKLFAGLVSKADKAIDSMKRDELIAYAAANTIDLGVVKERTPDVTLRKRIRDALEASTKEAKDV